MSLVELSRRSLSLLGARSSFQNFNEDSAEARKAKLWSDFSRTQLLASYDWPFARKTEALALHPEPAREHWDFRYYFPADALALRGIVPVIDENDDTPPHAVELFDGVRTILTTVEQARMTYTVDVTDTTLMPLPFQTALVWLQAHNMAYDISGKQNLAERMFQQVNFYIEQAKGFEGDQDNSRPGRDAPWIRGR